MAEERFRRKLAAILAADVAGYSRLTETDEETGSSKSVTGRT
jgi:class 3 adenylate cyclase